MYEYEIYFFRILYKHIMLMQQDILMQDCCKTYLFKNIIILSINTIGLYNHIYDDK